MGDRPSLDAETEYVKDLPGFEKTHPQFFRDRMILWTSGSLAKQMALITGYTLTGGRGHFTVNAMTQAPSNTDTFEIV